MIALNSGTVVLLIGGLIQYAAAALQSNSKGSPQDLSGMSNSNVCTGPGRTSACEVQLDVPSQCVSNGQSTCPVVFYLHGAGGKIAGFKNGSDVHTHGFIGVYPQGENGWNTGPKDTNNCDYSDYNCVTDPDEADFIASIISEVRALGADGSIYVIGNSNGAALAHRLAVNAGTQLPVKGIVTVVTQLLASPDRSGPGTLNYNNPNALGGAGPNVSVLNVMGTGDGLIPYDGGSSSVFGGNDNFKLMSALDSMAIWASHNGCSPTASSEGVSTDTSSGGDGSGVYYKWENCSGGTIVEHYAINGAGHGAGGTEVNGVAINYDISADFIKRCESSESTPTVSPKPTRPPVPPTLQPTKAPSPPTVGCVDDPDWVGKNNAAHNCNFVGKMPDSRCEWENSEGVIAFEACRLSCENCEDTQAPTASPIQVPPSDCPLGESKFLVELLADEKSKKQNLYLIQRQKGAEETGSKWKKIVKKKKFTNSALNTFDICLESSNCYRFRIKDKAKNGLCCKNGEGGYAIQYEGKELKHAKFDEDFGKRWQNKKFGNCSK